MSHVAVQMTKPGEPMFADRAALKIACTNLGLEIVETNQYRWYGRSVGDTSLPKGMRKKDLGKNAAFVIKLNAEKRKEATARHGSEPYDIGMIEDPNNKGCFVPMYDYFCGGYGVDDIVGEPLFKDGGQILCPKLKQQYDMVCDALAARESGDTIEFLTLKDASAKYPEVFPTSVDVDTWVSVADTSQRIGV